MLADTLELGNAATPLAARLHGNCQDFHKNERFSRRLLHWPSLAFWPPALPAAGFLACLHPWRFPVVSVGAQVADAYEGWRGESEFGEGWE